MPLPIVCRCSADEVHCFDDKTRKPCTGTCGHTVCLEYAMRYSRCPVCKLEGAFNKVSVNFTSIALLEDCRKRFWENWRQWMNKKAPDAGFCSKLFEETQLLCSICVDPVKVPRICLTCDQEALFKKNQWHWDIKMFGIGVRTNVLKVLQRVMCSNCAIDNHGAEGHEIVKQEINKKSKKLITMALAQNVLDMFKDAVENKKGVIDCFMRRLEIQTIEKNLLKVIGGLQYIEEWECGYLGELIKKELIKKYMENVDEKMLDLFGTEGNSVCNRSKINEELETMPLVETVFRVVNPDPRFSESGEEFSGVATIVPAIYVNCPLCVYNGYRQHKKKYFLLKNGVSVIEELCKTEMIPLDKCCLNCLDILNDCQFLLSCKHRKKRPHSFHIRNWYREKKRYKERKSCYKSCFMKNSTLWNFVIINHMMADDNLHDVIIHEIEQTVGFDDCQLQKVRMKEMVNALYEGLHSSHFWECFDDHLSKPIEMDALLKSFKQQWKSFRNGNGEQKTGSRCECTLIWNKITGNEVDRKKYEDFETAMIDMARYFLTEKIHGCPMKYNHGIELNMDVMDELNEAVCFEATTQETELNLNKEVKCMMGKIALNVFAFAHLHCRNEEKQLFDDEIHQPYTGSCGHTICSVCIENTFNEDCPACGKEESFEGHQLNEELIREIETIKQNAWELFKELWNNEAAESGACSKCNKSTSDLHLCVIDFENLTFVSGSTKRLIMKSTADVLKLSRHVLCQECASARTDFLKKINSIPSWKNQLKKINGLFFLEFLEDEIGGEENCQPRQVEIQRNRKQLIKVLEELNYEQTHECGYKRDLIKLKLIEKLIVHLDRSAKQQQPIKEKNCPLCVMIHYLDRSERNQNDWMNVLDHLWSSQPPRFKKCCIHCLFYLNNQYSELCQTKIEVMDIGRISNAICEGIEKGQIQNFKRVLTFVSRNDDNTFVNDEKTWEMLMIEEYFFCLLQTMIEGLSRTTFTCYLRKSRIYNLAYLFLSEFSETSFKNYQYWIVIWNFFETSSIINSLKIQYKKLRDEMNKEETGVECECTDIWERNQIEMKKFGHKGCEEKRKLQELEDSMEEMARFSLEVDLDGCPMKYNHGIELDEEIVKLLKESTDLEAETKRNKCLCLQIDSLGPSSNISDANLYQIVPLFTSWWKYEAGYPHLLFHACVDCLELIQELFWKLHESGVLSWREPEKFLELIHYFQINKGRVSERKMKQMTREFKDFISEWNSLPFPPIQTADPNQPEKAVATAGNISQGQRRKEKPRPRPTEGQPRSFFSRVSSCCLM